MQNRIPQPISRSLRVDYQGSNLQEKEAMLFDMFENHTYDRVLAPMIAAEPLDFICHISTKMWQPYRYLFNDLLCAVERAKGLDATVDVIVASGIMAQLTTPDFINVRRLISTDANPFHPLYQQVGPSLFVALHRRSVADFKTLYLWTASQPNPDHEAFTLAMAESYAHDPDCADEIIGMALLLERAIATAQLRPWSLKSHAGLLLKLMDVVSSSCLSDACTLLFNVLAADKPLNNAENLAFALFLQDFVGNYRHADDAADLCRRFWVWISSAPPMLAKLNYILTL